MTFTPVPTPNPRQHFEQVQYRSPYIFDFRARDLSVTPRTSHEPTFSRASDADGTGATGNTITYPVNFPNWTHTDHGVGLQFGAGSSEDILHYPYHVAPRDISIYLAWVDEGLFQEDGILYRLFQNGVSGGGGEDDQIQFIVLGADILRVFVRVGGVVVSTSDVNLSAIGSSIGDLVELVVRVIETGAELEWALNGSAFTASAPGSAFTHPSAYTTEQLNVGSDGAGGDAVDAELLSFVIADGDISADDLRSQLS